MPKTDEWIAAWLDAVAAGTATMSQRQVTSIEVHGGVDAVVAAAMARRVHLVRLTDDRGVDLVAAGRHPFTVLC
jgi:hypothetical protein